MEKEILSRINDTVASLQEQLDALKALVAGLSETAPEEGPAAAAESADPIDISFDDAPFDISEPEPASATQEPVAVELEPETAAEPAPVELDDLPEPVMEPEPVAVPAKAAEPEPAPAIEPEPEPAPVQNPKPAPKPARKEPAATAKTPVKGWRTDIPGSPVANIISGISLNDRVLFINTLFKEDPMLFQSTVSAFNKMSSLADAENYIAEHFPEWNLNSDIVYRLMMAIRRKLK